MNVPETADAAHRVASAIQNSGAGVAITSGTSMGLTIFLGFTPGQWQVIGVLGGLLIGALGLALNWYFQHQRLTMDRRKLRDSE